MRREFFWNKKRIEPGSYEDPEVLDFEESKLPPPDFEQLAGFFFDDFPEEGISVVCKDASGKNTAYYLEVVAESISGYRLKTINQSTNEEDLVGVSDVSLLPGNTLGSLGKVVKMFRELDTSKRGLGDPDDDQYYLEYKKDESHRDSNGFDLRDHEEGGMLTMGYIKPDSEGKPVRGEFTVPILPKDENDARHGALGAGWMYRIKTPVKLNQLASASEYDPSRPFMLGETLSPRNPIAQAAGLKDEVKIAYIIFNVPGSAEAEEEVLEADDDTEFDEGKGGQSGLGVEDSEAVLQGWPRVGTGTDPAPEPVLAEMPPSLVTAESTRQGLEKTIAERAELIEAKRRSLEEPARPVWIYPDIHGDADKLKETLKKVPEGVQIGFVGDLIDRGPNSKGVLEIVKDWVENKGAKLCMGNHEELLLVSLTGDMATMFSWLRQGGAEFARSFGIVTDDLEAMAKAVLASEEIRSWAKWLVKNAHIYHVIDDQFMVHAGFPVDINASRKIYLPEYKGLQGLDLLDHLEEMREAAVSTGDFRQLALTLDELASIKVNGQNMTLSPLWTRRSDFGDFSDGEADETLKVLNSQLQKKGRKSVSRIIHGHTKKDDGPVLLGANNSIVNADTGFSSGYRTGDGGRYESLSGEVVYQSFNTAKTKTSVEDRSASPLLKKNTDEAVIINLEIEELELKQKSDQLKLENLPPIESERLPDSDFQEMGFTLEVTFDLSTLKPGDRLISTDLTGEQRLLVVEESRSGLVGYTLAVYSIEDIFTGALLGHVRIIESPNGGDLEIDTATTDFLFNSLEANVWVRRSKAEEAPLDEQRTKKSLRIHSDEELATYENKKEVTLSSLSPGDRVVVVFQDGGDVTMNIDRPEKDKDYEIHYRYIDALSGELVIATASQVKADTFAKVVEGLPFGLSIGGAGRAIAQIFVYKDESEGAPEGLVDSETLSEAQLTEQGFSLEKIDLGSLMPGDEIIAVDVHGVQRLLSFNERSAAGILYLNVRTVQGGEVSNRENLICLRPSGEAGEAFYPGETSPVFTSLHQSGWVKRAASRLPDLDSEQAGEGSVSESFLAAEKAFLDNLSNFRSMKASMIGDMIDELPNYPWETESFSGGLFAFIDTLLDAEEQGTLRELLISLADSTSAFYEECKKFTLLHVPPVRQLLSKEDYAVLDQDKAIRLSELLRKLLVIQIAFDKLLDPFVDRVE